MILRISDPEGLIARLDKLQMMCAEALVRSSENPEKDFPEEWALVDGAYRAQWDIDNPPGDDDDYEVDDDYDYDPCDCIRFGYDREVDTKLTHYCGD